MFIPPLDMQTVRPMEPQTAPPPPATDPKAAQIVARTLYRDMVQNGLCPEQILSIASELIDRVTQELKQPREPAGRA